MTNFCLLLSAVCWVKYCIINLLHGIWITFKKKSCKYSVWSRLYPLYRLYAVVFRMRQTGGSGWIQRSTKGRKRLTDPYSYVSAQLVAVCGFTAILHVYISKRISCQLVVESKAYLREYYVVGVLTMDVQLLIFKLPTILTLTPKETSQ